MLLALWDVPDELTELAKKEEDREMAFEELKSKQSVMWGNGEYQNVTETIADVHDLLIERLDPQEGDAWLDLACGTGAVSELAAKRGASVTGIDLAPALIETAKERAEQQGLDIDYRVGDCENLDLEDGAFDIVSSTFGVMFAPDHQAAASELARVVKPGGRIGLATWTPEGGVGKMFAMMKPFQPPLPEGAGAPPAWGTDEHVHELLGSAFDLSLERHVSHLQLASGEAYWEMFTASFGPAKTLAETLDDDRREEFHRAWVDFFESNYKSNGEIDHEREWLLVLGTRR